MVYHGFWLVPMVLLVENTTKLYPGPTIQSRPCRPKAGFGLVMMMMMFGIVRGIRLGQEGEEWSRRGFSQELSWN